MEYVAQAHIVALPMRPRLGAACKHACVVWYVACVSTYLVRGWAWVRGCSCPKWNTRPHCLNRTRCSQTASQPASQPARVGGQVERANTTSPPDTTLTTSIPKYLLLTYSHACFRLPARHAGCVSGPILVGIYRIFTALISTCLRRLHPCQPGTNRCLRSTLPFDNSDIWPAPRACPRQSTVSDP